MKSKELIILNGISVPIFKTDDGEILISVTSIAKSYGKRVNDWMNLISTKNYLKKSKELLPINKTISIKRGGDCGRGGGYTLLNLNAIYGFINWTCKIEDRSLILHSIINGVINLIIESSPIDLEKQTDNTNWIYEELIKIIDEDSLINQFKVDEINIKESLLIKDKGNGKYFFYFLTSKNSVIKMSKEDILMIFFYNLRIIPKHIFNYLDSLITQKDITYLRVKYSILSSIFTTYINERVSGSSIQKTYLMKDSNTGLTKIGKAVDPKYRERTLQSEKPTISLFAVCEDNVESKLHEQYKDKRVRGEWFNLTGEEIKNIINKFKFIKN